jgi:hypothetical protein
LDNQIIRRCKASAMSHLRTFYVVKEACRTQVRKPGRTPGALLVLLGGGRVDCMRDMFILKEIWAQGNIYTYIWIGTLHGSNIVLITYW